MIVRGRDFPARNCCRACVESGDPRFTSWTHSQAGFGGLIASGARHGSHHPAGLRASSTAFDSEGSIILRAKCFEPQRNRTAPPTERFTETRGHKLAHQTPVIIRPGTDHVVRKAFVNPDQALRARTAGRSAG